MTDRRTGQRSRRTDPGGLLVAVCTGHRCAALRRLDGEDDPVGASLRDAVRGSRGGVLVASPCLGACARAPVAAVGHRSPGQELPAGVVRLGDLDPSRREALAAWVAAEGSRRGPGSPVPDALRASVLVGAAAPRG